MRHITIAVANFLSLYYASAKLVILTAKRIQVDIRHFSVTIKRRCVAAGDVDSR